MLNLSFFGNEKNTHALSPAGLLIFCFLIFFNSPSLAEALTGKIVGVHDGDTVTLLDTTKHQTKIRLAEIDAPELKQPYGMKSKQMLSDLIFGRDVSVEVQTIDKYGRTVGHIYQGDIDVNLTMVKQGGAWAYRQYMTDDAIATAEDAAKAAGIGLWGLQEDQRMPPWEFRHGGRQPQKSVAIPSTPVKGNASFTCAGKRYCREMTSCAEAMFYLTQCGLSRLDGDHDGVPCESICR